ncbi:hypothetical protein PRUPE_3G265400 [Prunus persica]|uniref:Uncharacterized protein n=1 Tax=Prunus persica TaxID=3760 RepID=A0A251Q5X6_PRUPE|nr:hypothetical protein PRUPE_3G265400 [Prunus persica]
MHPCKVTSKLFGLCTHEKLHLNYSFSSQIPVHWIRDFDRTVLDLLLLCTKAEIINTYLECYGNKRKQLLPNSLFIYEQARLSLSLYGYISMFIRPNTAKRLCSPIGFFFSVCFQSFPSLFGTTPCFLVEISRGLSFHFSTRECCLASLGNSYPASTFLFLSFFLLGFLHIWIYLIDRRRR